MKFELQRKSCFVPQKFVLLGAIEIRRKPLAAQRFSRLWSNNFQKKQL